MSVKQCVAFIRVCSPLTGTRASRCSASICFRSGTAQHSTSRLSQVYQSALSARSTLRSSRAFSSSSILSKKGGKAARDAAREEKQEQAQSSGVANEDPYDLSALDSDISTLLERLKSTVSKLRPGGKLNPEIIENLRVQLSKESSQTVKVGDVAQIVPKGRTVQVFVGEADYIKPVTSAIQTSSLSLSPQPDPTGANPLLLVINIPPPTAESRKIPIADAEKAGEKASMSLRDARAKQQKKLRALQLSKAARPDDIKKATALMEKTVEKGTTELKKIVDNIKKVLNSG